MSWRSVRIVVALVALATGLAAPASRAAAPLPPNILIIVTDDQRLDQQSVMTKTNELFQAQGVTFSNAYDATPLCCPSRASIFSGRYAHNHGVNGNTIPDVNHLDLTQTVQRALHDAGYQTGIAGKIFNGWDVNRRPPDFDRFAITPGGYGNATYNVDGKIQTTTQYSTDFISNQSKSMLDQFQADPKHRPWFLYVAPFAPHFPYTPSPGDVNASVGSLRVTPSITETDKSDKPPWIANNVPVNLGKTPNQVWQDQARSLLQVDRMVARLFANQQKPRDTLAFFISDNGYLLGEHGIAEDKRIPYTESVHVPLMMRWPARFAGGTTDSRYAMNVDITPTIVQAANLPLTRLPKMDGRSLLGSYRRSEVLLEGYASKENPTDPGFPPWSSILNDNLQLTEWYGPKGNLAFRELYNRKTDPWQLNNLFALAPGAAQAQTLTTQAELARIRTCTGTTGLKACP